jgi:hypothetical protein
LLADGELVVIGGRRDDVLDATGGLTGLAAAGTVGSRSGCVAFRDGPPVQHTRAKMRFGPVGPLQRAQGRLAHDGGGGLYLLHEAFLVVVDQQADGCQRKQQDDAHQSHES